MDISYVYVDTCVLADIIKQYDPLSPHKPFQESKYLKKNMLKVINHIIEDYDENSGYVITSTFAFVELINKFNTIFESKITMARLLSIMKQPPSWLIVEEMNDNTALHFCDVPNSINGNNISSDDAVHIATALQRGDNLIFLTTDNTLSQLKLSSITFINS